MLKMSHLSKVYRTHMVETHALRGFDIHVREGEFVAVTGPSGSGKTTFLNIAGLLEEFTDGEFLLDGVDVKGMNDNQRSRLRNEKIGFVFQGFNLIPDLNLFDNVDVPLRYRGSTGRSQTHRERAHARRSGFAHEARSVGIVGRPATTCRDRARAGRLAAPAARGRADWQFDSLMARRLSCWRRSSRHDHRHGHARS